jgi:hydroxyacylglutathione hydrolase
MLVRRFFTPGLAINSYLIFDEEKRQGALIDPTRQIELYVAKSLQENIDITDIIETHVHADFVSGALELKEALGGKPIIHCSGMGGKEWIPSYADHVVQHRDELHLGPIRLEAWHTPGHTPEHLIWIAFDEKRAAWTPELAFTGDLLFVGSVGRPDLMGRAAEEHLSRQLYHSLFKGLEQLPDYVEILPGHGAGSLCGNAIGTRDTSTVGYERRSNPWMIPQNFTAWHDRLLQEVPAPPAYFGRMKKLNLTGIVQRVNQEMPMLLTGEQLKSYASKAVVVDVRKPDLFAAAHLKNSLNVPFTPSFPLWAAMMIEESGPLLLILDQSIVAINVLQALRLVGIDNICGLYDATKWQSRSDSSLVQTPLLSVDALQKVMNQYYILDVRSPAEWHRGHIANAHHIELARIKEEVEKIPSEKPVAVICHSGNRASLAASWLNQQGFKAQNVQGGMQAWALANFRMVKDDRQE